MKKLRRRGRLLLSRKTATKETKLVMTIPVNEVLEQLPVEELETSKASFLEPIVRRLRDKRLKRVVGRAVSGILGSESPIVTQMAQVVERTESGVWASSKQLYRFLQNERFSYETIAEGLYEISHANVMRDRLDYLVVAIDPVNLEKPYTEKLEGVSTVHKSTPPDRNGKPRLTKGYPCITASVVNSRIPATTYANWFSYATDFVSMNVEIQHAIDATNMRFPDQRVRYVLDAGFDDRRWFAELGDQEFVTRASHMERRVEVFNDRLNRWESETLGNLVDVTLFAHTCGVAFTHARKTRIEQMQFGWFRIRLPDTQQVLWVIVAQQSCKEQPLVLLTNVPLHIFDHVRSVYNDWRLRSRIEHGYRFDQEQGLDIEDIRVHKLERMKRLFLLVLAAAQFVFYLIDTWPPQAIVWIRSLGGKLHLKNDLDGPYLVLRGISALLKTVATLTHNAVQPFPKHIFVSSTTCG